ncbi:hypothetical protein DACRYDRAFT_80957 [Dacryopinax primogenitus]|uniref:CCHC-type domain-containing protein n=1 Tax=Dacryopinax primogenitus (strain DJM 731) TaxID=1858805 RepID=M5G4J9_DACPD|nr:uncharacterized protein DACRYDRAFT_80957 [Dacryopinax primogenitus]EJU00762.1 hypothetical protein DACRYDRAFT_80957 [Dacryopinax primogenitus]
MAEAAKILVLGSAHGAIPAYLSKLRTFNTKHGPFDAIFCIGDFFTPSSFGSGIDNEGVQDLVDGKLDIPVPTFVLASPNFDPPQEVKENMGRDGGEICKNLAMLQGVGRLEIPGKGVYVSYDSSSSPVNVADLEPASSTHILLTYAHPSLVFSSLPTATSGENEADLLLKHRKPRYAFSGSSGVWSESEPFGWSEQYGTVKEWTRCVSVGSMRGEGGKKQRFYYAFSIAPLQAQPHPPNAIPNPYLPSLPSPSIDTSKPAAPSPADVKGLNGAASTNKRKFEAIAAAEASGVDFRWGGEGKKQKTEKKDGSGKPPEGYRCRLCDSPDHYIQACPIKIEQDKTRAKARETDKPPEGYTCNRCGSSEHFVRNCPTRGETGDTGGAKPPDGYVCKACGGGGHYFKDCEIAAKGRRDRGRGGRGSKEITPDECWFCLSNPNVAKYLITSIGSETYLTLPKGSLLPLKSTLPTHVPGGGHLLIIPITHHPTLLSLPPDISLPITAEIESYKSALRAVFREHGCVAVSWEIARLSGRGGHAHMQVCAAPLHLSENGKLEEAFRREGEAGGVDWEEELPGEAGRERDGNYLRVELPGGKVLVHNIRPGPPFNLQFPRMVLGKLFGLEDRIDWHGCPEGQDEEREAAEAFKAAFAKYDPTLA